jgi:ABC-type uncharacterized transport system substrate-binding protein
MRDLSRRGVIGLIGGAVASPMATRAQQEAGLPVVGFVNGGGAMASRSNAFREGLSTAGFIEGRNVRVEYHWLDGHYDRAPAVLSDLVSRRVAVIATPGSDPVSLAAKAATAKIPIVFGVAKDPVAMGLVESFSRPGGNATGINFFAHEIEAKLLGLMHELLPKGVRFAVLVNPSNASNTEATTKSLHEAARALGLEVRFFNASTPAEIDTAFSAFGT